MGLGEWVQGRAGGRGSQGGIHLVGREKGRTRVGRGFCEVGFMWLRAWCIMPSSWNEAGFMQAECHAESVAWQKVFLQGACWECGKRRITIRPYDASGAIGMQSARILREQELGEGPTGHVSDEEAFYAKRFRSRGKKR